MSHIKQNKIKYASVAIIGGGITGMSTVYHLKMLGIKDILLIDSAKQDQNVTDLSAGILWGDFLDNFTRFTHVFGASASKKIWQFANDAHIFLEQFLTDNRLSYKKGDRIRLIRDQHELDEMKLAVSQLQREGLNVEKRQAPKGYPSNYPVQFLAEKGGVLNTETLLEKLSELSRVETIYSRVTKLKEANSVVLELENGELIKSEFVVLANHLNIRNLEPRMATCLVPVVEQYIKLRLSGLVLDSQVGDAFSYRHGYYWGSFLSEQMAVFGGARFLRKLAGIGSETADLEPKITDHLKQEFVALFNYKGKVSVEKEVVGLSCRPCDELPIIGPMYGSSRVLLASGYMLNGLSLGFFSGKCLADLIASGVCPELPRSLWPERLRSLSK